MIGTAVGWVGETFFEDGKPADAYDQYTTNQSRKKQDFNEAHRKNHH